MTEQHDRLLFTAQPRRVNRNIDEPFLLPPMAEMLAWTGSASDRLPNSDRLHGQPDGDRSRDTANRPNRL